MQFLTRGVRGSIRDHVFRARVLYDDRGPYILRFECGHVTHYDINGMATDGTNHCGRNPLEHEQAIPAIGREHRSMGGRAPRGFA